jgi:hypothetical protein
MQSMDYVRDSGWNSKIERNIIMSGLFLLISCFLIIAYKAFHFGISVEDKLIGIVTVLLGYLFGYLPLKASEVSAVKELKKMKDDLGAYQIRIENLEKGKSVAVESSNILKEIQDENRQLKEDIKELSNKNLEYENYLKELVPIQTP